jgi:hypothetical protein
MRQFIHRRLPGRKEIYPVFAILLFLVNSWMLYRYFWVIPSWMEYLSLTNLLVVAAYTFGHSLLESLLALAFILGLCLLFPPGLFRDCFTAQGSLVALGMGGVAVLLQRQVSIIYRWELWQIAAYPALFLAGLAALILGSALAFRRYPRLAGWVNEFAERMTVFGLLYIPLGVLGLVVVIIRNLV